MASSMDELMDGSEKMYSELCKICLRNKSVYVCPRCSTPYCSLDCYKSELHADCSESFYQEWVENELKCNRVSSEGQKKMLEILSRMHQESESPEDQLDSDDEEPPPDLADRLAGVDLNDANKVWEKLSTSEQTAFKELVKSGGVADIIPPWEPWWTIKYNIPSIVPVEEDLTSCPEDYKERCPPVHKNIKPFLEICKTKPAATIVYDLINILGGYVLAARYFNGEYHDVPEEVATIIFNISQSLISAQKFSSFEMAIEAVGLQALISDSIDAGEEEIVTMKEDVQCIIYGPSNKDKNYYILSALSDLHNLFSFKKNKNRTNKSGKFFQLFPNSNLGSKLIDNTSCRTALRRIAFMQSWTNEFDCRKMLN